jgi:subtilase family serine protease
VTTPFSDWDGGSVLVVTAQVKNVGNSAANKFQIEFRLSTDNVITTTDPLLSTVQQSGLAAGASADLSRSVTIPAGTAKGDYYVGMRINAKDANKTNNTVVEATATTVFLTSLTGTVTYGRTSKSVSIQQYQAGGTPIFDDRPAWIVIHGRNSSSV